MFAAPYKCNLILSSAVLWDPPGSSEDPPGRVDFSAQVRVKGGEDLDSDLVQPQLPSGLSLFSVSPQRETLEALSGLSALSCGWAVALGRTCEICSASLWMTCALSCGLSRQFEQLRACTLCSG